MNAPSKLTRAGKKQKGEYDEKEYLEVTTDRLAGCGDIYRA
jgi:hypothetical protein